MAELLVFAAFGGCAAVLLLVLQRAGRAHHQVVEAWVRAQGWTPVRIQPPRWPVFDPLWRTRFDVEAIDAWGRTQRGTVTTNGKTVAVLRRFDWTAGE